MPSRRPSRLALAAAVLVCAGACRERVTDDDAAPAKPSALPAVPAKASPTRVIYPAAPGSFVDLAADLRPSVVHIASTTKVSGGPATMYPGGEADYALGSGFLVDRDGYIVTSDHVIANAREIRVVLDDNIDLPANVVGRDAALDIALLKIKAPRLQPVTFGDSDELQVGEWVIAVGNPFGDEMTVSAGIVSAIGRTGQDHVVGPESRRNFRSYVHTDASINPANSGGPLVNTAGQVVGVNTYVPGRRAGAGMNYAVPVNRLTSILKMLKKDGAVSRAWLGIMIHPVTQQVARERKLAKVTGALVSDVIAGGPAARAGIKPGDVILEYAEHEVDHRNFPWIASTTGIGEPVQVVVSRNGKTVQLELITEKMPK